MKKMPRYWRICGGSWSSAASDLRASNRRGFDPSLRDYSLGRLGFRLVRRTG